MIDNPYTRVCRRGACLEGREAAGEDKLANERDWHAQLQRLDRRPLACHRRESQRERQRES